MLVTPQATDQLNKPINLTFEGWLYQEINKIYRGVIKEFERPFAKNTQEIPETCSVGVAPVFSPDQMVGEHAVVQWLACWTTDLKVHGLRPGFGHHFVSLDK